MDARPLRVGIDGRELAGRPTGTGRYLRSLLRHWRDSGDSLVVYVDGAPPDDPILRHPSIQVRPVGKGRSRGLLWQQRLLPAAARADGLHVFFSPAYSCPLPLGVPRVTAVHDLSYFSYPQDFPFHDAFRRRLLGRLSIRASSRIPVCSDFTRREMERLFPDAATRVRHVPLGADEDLAPVPPRLSSRDRLRLAGPLLLTVGAVLNRRCLPELLRATARLRRRHPRVLLDVVGPNRTHPRLRLDALASGYGLADNVRFSDYVDETALAERYAAADVAVFLSEYEGFGLPAIEAASRGVPLVTSRAPALGEVFREAAVLVDPRNEGAIAQAIDRVLSDPALADRLRVAGRALAAAHCWRSTAQRTHELLVEAARR